MRNKNRAGKLTKNGGLMSVQSAAVEVLKGLGVSFVHYKVIAEVAIKDGFWKTDGLTPASTMGAVLGLDIKKNGDKSLFVRGPEKGEFGLSGSGPVGEIKSAGGTVVLTPKKKGRPKKEKTAVVADRIVSAFLGGPAGKKRGRHSREPRSVEPIIKDTDLGGINPDDESIGAGVGADA